jgi:SWI/SNF-related matrix-associated actin-dependent regulator 1 of chromatin subfamily A
LGETKVTASPPLAPIITLEPHQREGIEFLLEKKSRILGDDVGLGKTFQALEAALRATSTIVEPYVLIVVPAHLMLQWRESIRTYLIGRRDLPVHVLSRYSKPTPDLGWGIHLVPYTNLQNLGRKKYPWPWRRIWDVIVADEAHRMRKPKTQTAKNFDMLAGRRVFLLTGTPSENNPADIYNLLHFVEPKEFRSYWGFVEEWMLTWKDPWKVHIIGVHPDKLPKFHGMVGKYMIRRTREFAPVWPIDIPVQVTEATARAHKEALKSWRLAYPADPLQGTGAWNEYVKSAGALIAKLRLLVSQDPAKLDAALGVLEDVSPEAPLIYFTWYRDTAEALASYLEAQMGNDALRSVTVMHGGVSQEERHAMTTAWRDEAARGKGPILVGTMGSIGEGLDLQAAAHAAFYEEHYLPGTMHQALGRVNRMGQSADKIVRYWIHAIGTVESSVHYVQSRRHESINSAIVDHLLETLGEDL